MSFEVAGLLVSAEWDGRKAEDGLDRLGVKFDKTTDRMRGAEGRFVSFKSVSQQLANQHLQNVSVLDQVTGSLQQTAGAVESLGRKMTVLITLPVVAALGGVVHVGSQTSATLNRLAGVSGATDAEMKKVRATARALGADLSLPGTSAKDAALAMLELTKGGLSLEKSQASARGTIETARAAMTDEATAARIVANALQTFELRAERAGHVGDVLANVSNRATGEMTDFALGLAQAGLVARASNMSLDETVAVLGLLANAGLKGSDAGTSLKSFLLSLRGPSDIAREAMEKLGVSAYDMKTGAMKDLPRIVAEFKAKLDTLDEESQAGFLDKVFGSDGARVAIALFRSGREELDAMTRAVGEAGGAQRMAAANTRGLAGAWDALLSTVETLADDIFEDLEAPLTQVVRLATGIVASLSDVWTSLSPGVKSVIAAVVAVAAAMGPVLVVVGSVVAAFAGLMGAVGGIQVAAAIAVAAGTTLAAVLAPVALIALKVVAVFTLLAATVTAAAAGIAYAWSTNLGGIRDVTANVLSNLRTLWNRVWPEISATASAAMNIVRAVVGAALAGVVALWSRHGAQITAIVSTAWAVVSNATLGVVRVVRTVFEVVAALIDGDWSRAWSKFVEVGGSAARAFGAALAHLDRLVLDALVAVVRAIDGAVTWVVERAKELGRRLVAALAGEILLRRGEVRDVLMAALAWAVANADANTFGRQLFNEFFSGWQSGAAGATLSLPAIVAPAAPGFDAQAVVDSMSAGVAKWNEAKANLERIYGGQGGGRKMNFGGAGKGGGGGAEAGVSAAKREADALVKLAQVAEDAVRRSSERMLADTEYFYGASRRTIEDHARARLDAQIATTNAALTVNAREMTATLTDTKLKGRERQAAIADINSKLEDIHHAHAQNVLRIQRDADDASRAMMRADFDRKVALLEETAAGFASVYQKMADRGAVAFTTATDKTFGDRLEIMLARQRELKRRQAEVAPGTEGFKSLGGELDVLAQAIQNFYAEWDETRRESGIRDHDFWASFSARAREHVEAVADLRLASSDLVTQAMEAAGAREEAIWARARASELERERLANERLTADLRREVERLRVAEEYGERTAEMIAAINARVEAEDEASHARRLAIVEKFLQKQRDKLRAQTDAVVDEFMRAVGRFREEGWGGFFRSVGESFRDLLTRMSADLLKSQLYNVLARRQGLDKSPTGGAAPEQRSMIDSLKETFLNFFGKGDAGEATAITQPIVASVDAVRASVDVTEQGAATRIVETLAAGDRNTQAVVATVNAGVAQIVAAVRASASSGGGGIFPSLGDDSESGEGYASSGTGPAWLTAAISQAAAIRRAGDDSVTAVEGAGAAQAGSIDRAGESSASTLTTVGQGIVSTLATMISTIAAGQGRGSFWRGLAFAALSGAINGAIGAAFNPDGEGGGGGSYTGSDGLPAPMARGGLLRGPGSGTSDSILGLDALTKRATAWVSNGEFVVNAAATARNRALLEAINSGASLSGLDGLKRLGTGGLSGAAAPASVSGASSSYVPPTVGVATGRGAVGGSRVEQHFHLGGVHIHANDVEGVRRSRGQVERQMHGSLRSVARRLT